jgi:hypothetical protein
LRQCPGRDRRKLAPVSAIRPKPLSRSISSLIACHQGSPL